MEQIEPCIYSSGERVLADRESVRLAVCAELVQVTDGEFNPSMKTLCKILETLENTPLGRTELAQTANVNYKRLSRCIALLQQKELVELAISDGRIVVKLTESGKMLAPYLSKLVNKTDTV